MKEVCFTCIKTTKGFVFKVFIKTEKKNYA
jgi:hypothetical protein